MEIGMCLCNNGYTIPPSLLNTQRTESVSAEVVFPGEGKAAPQVQATCDGLLQINTQALDEAFYQKHRASNMLVSAENIPGMSLSHTH